MTKIDPEATVGRLVADHPERSRIFETLGIDYCCGGNQPLSKICRDKGLNVQEVVRQLETQANGGEPGEKSWANASLSELADHIERTHHVYLKRELPRLGQLVRKVAAVHGANHPWLLELDGIYASFAAEMESHTLKEEGVLFPIIRDIEKGRLTAADNHGGSVESPIKTAIGEHDDAAHAMEKMRELSDDYTVPPDGCNSFRAMLMGLKEIEADTHRHVHKENSILFPRAAEAEARLRAAN